MKHSRKSGDYTRKVDRNRPFETPDLLKDHFISRLQILPIQMEISSRERRNLSLFSAHFGTRPNKMTQIFGFRIRVLFPIFPIFRKKMECKQRDVSHGLLYTSMSLFATYFFPQSLKSHVANVASGSVELFRAIKTNFQSKGIESKAMNGLYIYIYIFLLIYFLSHSYQSQHTEKFVHSDYYYFYEKLRVHYFSSISTRYIILSQSFH